MNNLIGEYKKDFQKGEMYINESHIHNICLVEPNPMFKPIIEQFKVNINYIDELINFILEIQDEHDRNLNKIEILTNENFSYQYINLKEDEFRNNFSLIILSAINIQLQKMNFYRSVTPHGNSVIALIRKISRGVGHKTNAAKWGDFELNPAGAVSKILRNINIVEYVELDNIQFTNKEDRIKLLNMLDERFRWYKSHVFSRCFTYSLVKDEFYNSISDTSYQKEYVNIIDFYNVLFKNINHWIYSLEVVLKETFEEIVEDNIKFI